MMLKPSWNFKSNENAHLNWPLVLCWAAQRKTFWRERFLLWVVICKLLLLCCRLQFSSQRRHHPTIRFGPLNFGKIILMSIPKMYFLDRFKFLGYDANATRLVPIDSIHDDHCRKSRSLRAILGPNYCYILLIRGINHRRKYCSDMVRKKVQCNGH